MIDKEEKIITLRAVILLVSYTLVLGLGFTLASVLIRWIEHITGWTWLR